MSFTRRTILVLGLLGSLGATTCSGDETGNGIERSGRVHLIPRDNGSIVFLGGSFEEPTVELYSVNEDGKGLRQLTDDGTYKTAVSPSPDGSRLAYAALSQPNLDDAVAELSSIYVIGADGTERSALCEACSRTAYAFTPEPSFDGLAVGSLLAVPDSLAWSPDGSLIAAPAAQNGVLLIDPDSGTASTIGTPEPVTAIAWSPDGRRLALSHTWFISPESVFGAMAPREGTQLGQQEERPGGIYLVDVDTGEVDEVVSTEGMAHVHGWSADGELIAFTRIAGGGRHDELTAYSIDEDRIWPLVPGERGAAALGAGWSPDGTVIGALIDQYDEEAQRAKDLWVVSSAGTDPRGLPVCRFEGAFDGDNCARGTIAWSPDGTTIAYRAMATGTPAESVLVLQDIDGSPAEVVRISDATFDIGQSLCCLAWLPAPS